jgi:TRAP-type C4-dicarboxylate transport system substrate-binding protein
MKTKYTFFVSIIIALIAALVLPSSAQTSKSASPPAGQKILRFAYSTPSKRSMSYGWEWLGPEFEKRTNGRYRIEYYPGETLFKMAAGFDSVVSNVAQITHVSIGSYERRLPVSNILCLPTLDFPSTLKGKIAAGNAFMELYQKFPQIQEEYKEVKVFGFHQLFPYVLVSKNKEVYLPEQFKGLKVGGTGDRMLIVSKNGGADVNQVPPDAYMNMDKGVIDAAFSSWSQVTIYKLVEVAKYIYDLGFGSGAFAMIMNLNTWNGMSPEDQKVFMELWPTAFEMATKNNLKDIQRGMKAATDRGVKIRKPTKTEIAAWRKAASPVIELWITKCKKVGVKDPEAILAEWEKLLQAYEE